MQGAAKVSSKRVNDRCGATTRKGPWMSEEDEVLLEYVQRHGPRDWSSIRSKGLLPRTGKSCRLRWVNKLQPNLKTGCKFSPEEERIVIKLQARFGNKWVRIATYLPGRTDNDVKNFWSTRQKRLARMLQIPLPSKSSKNQSKMPLTNDPPTFEVASLDLIPFEEESVESNQISYVDDDNREQQSSHQMPDDYMPNPTMPLLEPQLNWEPPQLQLENLPNPELDFPLLLESSDHLIQQFEGTGLGGNSSFLQIITENSPFLGLGDGTSGVKIEGHSAGGAPDSFFDDFPVDMLDFMEQPQPLPTPSGACGSCLIFFWN